MKQIIGIIALITGACAPGDAPETNRAPDSHLVVDRTQTAPDPSSYAFDQPSLTFVLPEELLEISGLSVLPDGRLAAVQDEEGILYVLNRESGTVEARLPFGETGDYEGVEWVGGTGYVLLSDGTIIELSGSMDDLRQTATYETALKRKNDTEGLGYDRIRGRLLIACKEDPGDGLDDDVRAIYAFDPSTGELQSAPAYIINTKEIERELSGKSDFKPSAVAVHPASGDVYVLSASDRAIVVLSGDGRLSSVHELSKELLEQPEGLAFLDDGTLFIASEGADGPAMLYEFRRGTAE